MSTLQFLAEWTLRSSILILAGALLLWAWRVKDASIRLAAWTAILCGSLLMPAFTAVAPRMSVPVMRPAAQPIEVQVAAGAVREEPFVAVGQPELRVSKPFDWARAAIVLYFLTAGALLLRLCVALIIGRRLLGASRATGGATEGIEIRESSRVRSPVALGVIDPAIVLPIDWREWDEAKLNAVLAHERSHIRRHDPAVQLLSAIHRAVLWLNPLSWFLHSRIVRVAEDASDDAAVAAIRDRAFYAEVVLGFMQRPLRSPGWQGVPMARYGRPEDRIRRILDGTALSRGVTRRSIASILVSGIPLAYLAAAANPQSPSRPMAAQAAPIEMPAPAVLAQTFAPQVKTQPSPAAKPAAAPAYLEGIGNVTAAYTVTVKPRVDGELMSVAFKEGSPVKAGDLLATVDPRPYQVQLDLAEAQRAGDQAQLDEANVQLKLLRQRRTAGTIGEDAVSAQAAIVAKLEGSVKTDQANVATAKLQLTYTQVLAPISGVAGLRLVDPGNIIRASATTGIVIINQLQPISVLFTIPEERLPQVLARLRAGANPPVEVWNRENSVRIATGRLVATDNQIDQNTGTITLKAMFDNQDGALFPNEFVNTRLLLNAK